MKYSYFIIFVVLSSIQCFTQTWSEDVAVIFYQNCTVCHNPNGIGEFSLIDYDEAYSYRSAINDAVESKYMPPWIADPSVAHYSGERLLTETEINTITDWIKNDCAKGDITKAPPPPIYNNSRYIQNEPDYQVQMPKYKSKATEHGDDYVCISIKTDLPNDKLIKAIEVIPGNIKTVHHALIFIDPSGKSTTDTIGGDCGSPDAGTLVTGYVPGSTPTVFPSNENFSSGIRLPKGSNIILAMHYPEGSFGEIDQTKVNFYFYDDNPINFRAVTSSSLIENWELNFAPNQKSSVKEAFPKRGKFRSDYTLLSVFPHMHLLGQSISSYFVNDLDTTRLISIPKWDFEWQDFYFFKYLQKIPTGSQLFGEATYDNTPDNPHNPNDPPIRVRAGLNTKDEMFLIFYHYMSYQDGDELVNVDSLNRDYLTSIYPFHTDKIDNGDIIIYPNPSSEKVTINYSLSRQSNVSLYIYDIEGVLIQKLLSNTKQGEGKHNISWNIKNQSNIAIGTYIYSMRINGQLKSGKIFITK